jgi:hypothetical protein
MDHFAMGVFGPDVLPMDVVDVVLELPEEARWCGSKNLSSLPPPACSSVIDNLLSC